MKKINYKKGFAAQGMVIIIAIAVIAGVAYYFGTKNVVAPKGGDVTVNATTTVTDAKCANGATNYPHCNADLPQSSTWKTYTDSKNGYSFQYPAKLSLVTTADTVSLSHTIPFENHDGGCDMKGDSELSKILGDFGLSIKVVSGEVKPSYVDGTYSKGVLNGNWAYMGAEGCGQTSYYFPIAGGKTLVITKNEIQILSDVVSPDVKAKVLAVPGVISQQEAKLIVDQILSSFKFTSSVINSTQSSLTVLSPNGGETLKIGDTTNIRWNGGKNPLEIMVETYSEGELVVSGWIDTKINPATGQYTWKVGSIYNTDSTGKKFLSTLPQGKYYIRVNDFKTGELDRSDSLFNIVFSTTQPSITVLSPNGGEIYKIGSTQIIKWNSLGNLKNKISIGISEYRPECYLNGKYICTNTVTVPIAPPTIASDIENNGQYSWVVGSLVYGGLVKEGKYKVNIIGWPADNSSTISFSSNNYFTINN